jgi:phage baseplate assembly protein W
MRTKDKNFLGTGWAFPPTFTRNGHTVSMVSDEIDIQQSLQILFSTSWKERIMLPKYGANLSPLQFETLSTTLLTKLRAHLEDAIILFEPRIQLEGIDFNKGDYLSGILYISIHYTIKKTNARHNLVYPYYYEEGSISKNI